MDTYEKKYKEALERARDFKNDIVHKELTVGESIMDYIFPELKESEDEEVRKEIITFISTTPKQRNRHPKWINWLEKQGESYTKRDVDNAYIEGMAFAKNELDKQREQKPIDYNEELKKCRENPLYFFDKYVKLKEQKSAWNEKDESHLIYCVRLINNAEGCSISEQENAIEWLKSLKTRYTWKPSDEQIDALKHYVDTTMDGDIDLLYQDLKELKGE